MSHDTVRTLSCGQGVEIQDACRRLNVTLAELKLLTTGNNLRRSIDFLNGVEDVPVEKPTKLLEFITTIPVSAYEEFAAEKHLAVDTSKKAKVKIAWVSDNFKKLFGTKVEKNVRATDVRLDKLLKASLDGPITDDLGGIDTCTIALAHFYDALAWKQTNNDLTGLIGYIESDVGGAPWAVCAYWDAVDGGWSVYAYSVSYPIRWDGGYQVVSR